MSTNVPTEENTRSRILRAAWGVLEERGADSRISDIADRAGVSRQAVYLHFGDRSRLLLALVDFMDATLGVQEMAARVFAADTGAEMLERVVDLNAELSPRIDRVARVLEAAQESDDDMAAAWNSRMVARRTAHRSVAQRIADDGALAPGWTVETAAALISANMLPALWRELTGPSGWSTEEFRARMTQFLKGALLGTPED